MGELKPPTPPIHDALYYAAINDEPSPELSAPRTERAWKQCVAEGGKYEPFHGHLFIECQKLERDLTAACGVLKKADRGFILGLACMGVHGQRDENGLCGKSLERWNELVEIQNKTNVFLARMKESGNG